jgi:hypothetical protein
MLMGLGQSGETSDAKYSMPVFVAKADAKVTKSG